MIPDPYIRRKKKTLRKCYRKFKRTKRYKRITHERLLGAWQIIEQLFTIIETKLEEDEEFYRLQDDPRTTKAFNRAWKLKRYHNMKIDAMDDWKIGSGSTTSRKSCWQK